MIKTGPERLQGSEKVREGLFHRSVYRPPIVIAAVTNVGIATRVIKVSLTTNARIRAAMGHLLS
uniref:Uncharacterized protein n=1 Tax=Candidatus Kentrum sp. LFY TaxID=2126342 RepID=A0A450WWJ0_9GAMM|nr:MAG: hypothetical protein BECKLFY1418C_GA0070996_10927 [Candidatus Kentron sp. LFY]